MLILLELDREEVEGWVDDNLLLLLLVPFFLSLFLLSSLVLASSFRFSHLLVPTRSFTLLLDASPPAPPPHPTYLRTCST